MVTPEQHILSIQRLLARYCILVDEPDLDGFAELWTPDAEMHVGRLVWRGRDEILANVVAAPTGLHLASLPDITLAGEQATGRQNYVFVNGNTHELLIGRYEDSYRLAEDGWRFAVRRAVFIRPPRPA